MMRMIEKHQSAALEYKSAALEYKKSALEYISAAQKDANETSKTISAAFVSMSGLSSSTAYLLPATSGRGGRGNSGTRLAAAGTPGSGNRSGAPATPGRLEGRRARIVGDHVHVGREGFVSGRGRRILLDAADGQPPKSIRIDESFLEMIED